MTEKRLQHRRSLNVSIEMDAHKNSYGVFAEVVAGEFNRILSNLIDNAIDALELTKIGKISLSVAIENNNVVVSIEDNGKGIPSDILPGLGEKGRTFGNVNGNGFGLYYARSLLEQWKGSLEIQSEIGKGTTLRLILPRVETPAWFVSAINIPSQATIAVLDDDQSIHQVWRMRFEGILGKHSGVSLLHFNEPVSFLEWHRMVKDHKGHLYLLDYELLGHEVTGLDLAERLKIENNSYLVSSRFEDISIRSRCEKSGIKLIPKSMAGFVPITAQFH